MTLRNMLGLSGGAAITAELLMCKMELAASNTKLLAVAQGKHVYIAWYNAPELIKLQVVKMERLTPGHAWKLRNLKALM